MSTTEAEIIALVQCVQEMMYVMKLVESLGIKVRKPIMVHSDNNCAVDLINGWSVGGGTKHIDCRIMFLRELKKEGIIRVHWIPTTNNPSDLFTKEPRYKNIQETCENNL